MKEKIKQIISNHSENIKKIALDIHKNPELGNEEFKASKWQIEYLEENGFDIEREFKGIKTAYKASFGAGHPVVCVTSEYDALPQLGHACGHNLIAGSSLATGIALKELIENKEFPGTIIIMGTPAEESAGGKVVLLREQALEGIDIVLQAHPCYYTSPSVRMAAVTRFNIHFMGKTAHAADSPEDGINALDATRLLFNGVDAWRQQLPETARVHGVITNGGERPNIIPDKSSSFFYIRSLDNAYLDKMAKRFRDIAKGAALMTNTELTIEDDPTPYKAVEPNYSLNNTFYTEADLLGLNPKWSPPCRASTDFGDMSCVRPGIQPFFDITDGQTIPLHTKGFAQVAKSDYAIKQMFIAAEALAIVGIKYFTDKEYRKQVASDFENKKGDVK